MARLFCTLNDLITDEHVGHSVREETKEPFQMQQNPFNTTPFDSKNVLTAIPVLKPLKWCLGRYPPHPLFIHFCSHYNEQNEPHFLNYLNFFFILFCFVLFFSISHSIPRVIVSPSSIYKENRGLGDKRCIAKTARCQRYNYNAILGHTALVLNRLCNHLYSLRLHSGYQVHVWPACSSTLW